MRNVLTVIIHDYCKISVWESKELIWCEFIFKNDNFNFMLSSCLYIKIMIKENFRQRTSKLYMWSRLIMYAILRNLFIDCRVLCITRARQSAFSYNYINTQTRTLNAFGLISFRCKSQFETHVKHRTFQQRTMIFLPSLLENYSSRI